MSDRFYGKKIVIGCAIYIFVMMGFLGLYSAAYALYPDAYSISVSLMGTLGACITISGLIASLFYATVSEKITTKGCLYFGIIALLVFSVVDKLMINVAGLTGGLVIFGLLNSFSTYTVTTAIVSNWYVQDRANNIALVMSASLLGMAFYQFAAGYLFTMFDLPTGMMIAAVVSAVILFFVTKFLIIADSPEKVGQKAYGEEQAHQILPQEVAEETEKETDTAGSGLYRNPTFWLTMAARLLGCGSVTFIAIYATMFFTDAGLPLATATTILSIMTLATAAFAFVSGKILEAFKVRKFIFFICMAAILSNLSMILYKLMPSMAVVVGLVVLYGIGYSTSTINNLISGLFFDKRDADNANSKIYAMLMAGNIILMPLCGVVVEKMGFITLYVFMIILNIISMTLYFMAIASAQRQGRKI